MFDRIPCEIFSEIIKLSYTSYRFDPSYPSQFDKISVPPIKATHVCRSWRTALLSNPTMWTCIRVTYWHWKKAHVDQFDQTLSRSGSCPLHVFIDLHAHYIDPNHIARHWYKLSVISQQMHRCRQLQIKVSAHLSPFVFPCLDKPVPMLQKSHLVIDRHESDSPEYKIELRRFHETLFSGHAPSLKHLDIQICDGLDNLQLSLFHNLSSLHILCDEDTHIDGDLLLDILQSSPYIHTLQISVDYLELQEPIVWMPSTDRRIILPHLQNLSIKYRCGVEMINLVLGHLDFPVEDITFDVKCNDYYHKISESALLLQFLSNWRFTSVSISDCRNLFRPGIQFSEEMDQGSTGSSFEVTSTNSASLDDLTAFLRMINTLDITHMSVRRVPFDGIMLRTILVSLQNLQYLRVYHGDYDEHVLYYGESRIFGSYLKALLPLVPQHSTKNSKIRESRADSESNTDERQLESDIDSNIDAYQERLFPCPSLRTLEVFLSHNDRYKVTLDEAHLPALSRCSRIREQAGYPLKCIANCGGLSDLAKDIEAWLRTHGSGLSIEVKVKPK